MPVGVKCLHLWSHQPIRRARVCSSPVFVSRFIDPSLRRAGQTPKCVWQFEKSTTSRSLVYNTIEVVHETRSETKPVGPLSKSFHLPLKILFSVSLTVDLLAPFPRFPTRTSPISNSYTSRVKNIERDLGFELRWITVIERRVTAVSSRSGITRSYPFSKGDLTLRVSPSRIRPYTPDVETRSTTPQYNTLSLCRND